MVCRLSGDTPLRERTNAGLSLSIEPMGKYLRENRIGIIFQWFSIYILNKDFQDGWIDEM